jgi:hypothetical protein
MPNKERYAREKAAAAERNTTPYRERIDKGRAKGYDTKQASGHAKGEKAVSFIKRQAARIGISPQIFNKTETKKLGDTTYTTRTGGEPWTQAQITAFIENARSQGKELVRGIYRKGSDKKGHTSGWYSIKSNADAGNAAAAMAAGLESYESDDDATPDSPDYDGDDLFSLAFV